MFGELDDSDIYENSQGNGYTDPADNGSGFSFGDSEDDNGLLNDSFLDMDSFDSKEGNSFESESTFEEPVQENFNDMQSGILGAAGMPGAPSQQESANAETPIEPLSQDEQPKQNSGRIYILLLILLLVAAAGMFFYKKNSQDAAPSAEQAMGDYFYDKAAGDTPSSSTQQAEQTATVDVDLTEPHTSQDKVLAQNTESSDMEKQNTVKTEDSSESKPLSAIEKAMLKKKKDADKESQVSLSSKPVIIPVATGGRTDPFMPYLQSQALASNPKFELIAPPTVIPEADPVVDELVETKISGIMYDPVRPSAIVNFGGADQLVHKGDMVKGYKILNITKNSVVIKYKTNIYQATVGQTLDEGVNLNPVSNLTSQFGGAYSKTPGNILQFNN